MSISFTEDMLKEAVIQADIYEIETLPTDDEIEYEFSNEFKRKMKKLIRKSKTRSPVGAMAFLRRRAVAFVAAIIILFASAMSVSAVRVAVFEFITEVYEKFTHIFFNEIRSSQDAAHGFAIYEPTYIPEGFKLVNKNTDGLVLLEYEKENDFISNSQQCLENVSININTEGVKLEELEFKGLPAKYYSNQGVQNLLWYDDKRVLFAWLQANGISSSYTASALYHSINEGDTLTSVTKHNSSTGNNFKYMYMINTSTYETDITPFSSLNTFRNIYEFAPNINNLVAANLTMANIYESSSNKLYEEIIIEEPQYESTELENERVDFELDNLYETKNETEKKLKSKNVLPSDAVLRKIVTFISEDISSENAEVLGYMFNYGHSIDGIDITSDLNGDYLKVFVNKKGIEYVKKRWTNIETKKSKKQLGDKKVINVLIGKEKVKELVNKSKNRERANQIKRSSGKIVYVRNAKNPNKYIPAWEYELDSGELIHVDCISGDIVEE